MNLRQISVFLENRKGRLASLTTMLADKGVNMQASSLADTGDYGVLHFITDNFDLAWQTLTQGGYSVCESKVMIVKVSHEPGSLARVLQIIEENEINIEYMYALPQIVEGRALILFRFYDHEESVQKLAGKNLETFKIDTSNDQI